MVYHLRLRKKGIVILPKEIREKLGVSENDILIADIKDGELILRPLKPKIVRVNPIVVEEILKDEGDKERRKEEFNKKKDSPSLQ
ncbi:AbrB/MazE/SpoVT family DNA-binding domain-containing protein [Sulfurisphaera ohwakuensis]|uniref:AbrB family looped-hinge helix DNA binding protein n=1 Tax=Sulfurisphaera ohwakuensis TaxID=69656 RepID=A0A650CLF5_SULOH|nr:AbrB/MazE/SpoVT family DNA-binding domain-containing protein [Sulfurisphaera ohwakuensis]MBB5253720.1 AbrB family looped-hinge helix DNA binding protein [Sulfurisphaera ohwakuensis]QGR18297.1 AbrB/MazE/SpoVT family DNA-binding domain-containing protein [Sulfurisphaera ohwakuensis]